MQARIAPSLGALEGEHSEVWWTTDYTNDTDPAVFMGLYGLPDFYELWRHKGKKYILWCGSDITHFQNGYWLEDGGNIRLDSTPIAQWIEKYCESWVENEVERKALEDMGITANVCPSFMGLVEDYDLEFAASERPSVYLSANKGREIEYGWGIVEEIADKCDVDFHLYGSSDWETKHHNVFIHGRIPKELMNEQIKTMQAGVRLNADMDGFSEILCKAVLWGQHAIAPESYGYAYIDGFRDRSHLIWLLNNLKYKTQPNEGREYYIKRLNQFPWNKK